MRILIVDDDHIMCRCLKQGIDWNKMGCQEVDVCYNGVQALEYIKEYHPDIVITDLKMPVMDGKELCRLTYESFPEIVFIFLSGYEDFVTAQLALRYHVKGYILKPLDRKSLEEVEMLVRDVMLQRENSEFLYKIMQDDYRDYLEQVLEQKDTAALQQFFERLEDSMEQNQILYRDVWKHLVQPLFGYRYRKKADTASLLAKERKLMELLEKTEERMKGSFVKQQYLEEINRENEENEENDLVRQMKRIIKENYMRQEFNVSMLAQIMGMSPTYLGRIFLEQTGSKPIDYIIGKRMEKACELLLHTTKTVKEVAEACGYADVNYFVKIFRRKTEWKPSEYRYRKREMDEKAD